MTLEEFDQFIDEAKIKLTNITYGYMQPQHEGDLLKADITFTLDRQTKLEHVIGIYKDIRWIRNMNLSRKAPTISNPALFTIRISSDSSEYEKEFPSYFGYYPN